MQSSVVAVSRTKLGQPQHNSALSQPWVLNWLEVKWWENPAYNMDAMMDHVHGFLQHLDWFPLLDSNDNGVFLVNRWEVFDYSYTISKIGWYYSLNLSCATDLERQCSTWKILAILNVIIEGNLFPAEALSQSQKNVSETQSGNATFWSPLGTLKGNGRELHMH